MLKGKYAGGGGRGAKCPTFDQLWVGGGPRTIAHRTSHRHRALSRYSRYIDSIISTTLLPLAPTSSGTCRRPPLFPGFRRFEYTWCGGCGPPGEAI